MQDLTIAFCQTALAWHDWPANQKTFNILLEQISRPVDLVLLPETFTSGFTMQPASVAQTMTGPAVEWMVAQAYSLDAHLGGSLIIEQDGAYFNRFVCAGPDGTIAFYDKRHLFTYAGEHNAFTPGSHRLVFKIKGWRICPMICYDLRFPVWSRFRDDYDVLVYVANWPTPRVDAWEILLRARAVENQSYVIGVNRIGTDGNDYSYSGRSQVVDFSGRVLHHQGDTSGSGTSILNYQDLTDFRTKYNFLADKDAYILE